MLHLYNHYAQEHTYIKIKDKISIKKIKSKTNCKDIGYHIKKFKFKYAGHMTGGDKYKWNLIAIHWIPWDHKRHRERRADQICRFPTGPAMP